MGGKKLIDKVVVRMKNGGGNDLESCQNIDVKMLYFFASIVLRHIEQQICYTTLIFRNYFQSEN